MASFDARGFVNDFVSSMNERDPARLLRHYADDAVLMDPSTPEPVRGKDAIRKNWEQWSGAFGDAQFAVKDVVQSGDKVAIRLDAKVRHVGTLDLGPEGRLPPTNRLVELEVAEFLTVRDGKVARDDTIFDMASMISQLRD